jgi:hypothetical protein
MATKATAVTVTTTATQLDSTGDGYRSSPALCFYNNGSVTVYVGGASVTSASGAPVPAGSWSPGFVLGENEALYGITASSTAECRVLEQGVA